MQVVYTKITEVPNLGKRIKEVRQADSRTLKEICQSIGMSIPNWNRIENEKSSLPYLTLLRIEAALGVDFGVKSPDDFETLLMRLR